MSSLAAARADGYYYPKDWDPSQGSLNKYRKSHPLGERAKKINQGILVVRYETPFHIRCTKCKNMIGKGVRFNAEKKCVGKFHSTRIYEFKMNCHQCGNKILVQTDPEKCDYNYTEGAYKFLTTDKAKDSEDLKFVGDQKEVYDNRSNAFKKLQTQREDEERAELMKPELQKLQEQQKRTFNDYDINRQMRKQFMKEKKQLRHQEKVDKQPKNFGIKLATPNISDFKASLNVKFNTNEKSARHKWKDLKDNKKFQSIFKNKEESKLYEIQKKINKLPISTKKQIKFELKQKLKIDHTSKLSKAQPSQQSK